jgi:hypothetical protein
MKTLEELTKKIEELELRLQYLEKKVPNKKIITEYTSSMVKNYILEDKLKKKVGGE